MDAISICSILFFFLHRIKFYVEGQLDKIVVVPLRHCSPFNIVASEKTVSKLVES